MLRQDTLKAKQMTSKPAAAREWLARASEASGDCGGMDRLQRGGLRSAVREPVLLLPVLQQDRAGTWLLGDPEQALSSPELLSTASLLLCPWGSLQPGAGGCVPAPSQTHGCGNPPPRVPVTRTLLCVPAAKAALCQPAPLLRAESRLD